MSLLEAVVLRTLEFLLANWLEITATLFGVVCVYLSARQNVWTCPTGLVNVLLYVVVFWQARLYAYMGLQVLYAGAAIYGWWNWLHGGQSGGELPVTRTPAHWLLALVAGGAALSWALGTWLRTHTDAALPYLDSSLSAFSVVAQWQMTRKWVENWMLWILLDAIYIGMFINKELYPTAAQYTVFLGLAVMGLRDWTRSMRASAMAAAA